MARRRRSSYTGGISFYEEKQPGRLAILKEVALWGIYTVIALFLAAVAVFSFGFRTWAGDNAMLPLVGEGQSVLVNRLAYRMSEPDRGDVIAFYPGGNEDARPYIRRVVALPGQTVQITEEGVLLVDGTPDINSVGYPAMQEAGIAAQMLTLGNDEFFVLSEDRSNADDSRSASIGIVDEDDVIGQVWLLLPGGGAHLRGIK